MSTLRPRKGRSLPQATQGTAEPEFHAPRILAWSPHPEGHNAALASQRRGLEAGLRSPRDTDQETEAGRFCWRLQVHGGVWT